MRYCRFDSNGRSQYGLVEQVAGRDVITRVLLAAPEDANGNLEDVPSKRMDPLPLEEAKLAVPVRPTKIVCVGRNYHDRSAATEPEAQAEPMLFLKPPSSLLGQGGTILRPRRAEAILYEAELGVVIARACHHLSAEEDVRPYILGYTCVNEIGAQGVMGKDGQLTRTKGFDTFCPAGPVVSNEVDPWAGLDIATHVNGEVRQQGNTRDFIFPVDVVIRSISQVMTLYPGDLISTGSPKGAGAMVEGDVVEVSIAGLGVLRNSVAEG
jgi:2-keto-4-pentenoate hydratase/2-oxohepta-3-ene-1,7-dioic acid hydratase in catechol pathway